MMPRDDGLTKLKTRVKQAQCRITLQRFITVLSWSLFATLLLAVVAIAIPKFWALALAPAAWFWGWLGGGLAAGFILAVLWTYWNRSDPLDAAIEVDQRFQLRERVSSSLSLDESDMEGEAGQALLADAIRRLERIDVGTEFPIRLGWRNLLPVVPTLVVVLLVLLPNAQQEKELQAAQTKRSNQEKIRISTENLKKQAWQKKKKAEQLGLKNTQGTFDKLMKGLDELRNSNKGDRRDALRKLSNLNSEMQKRRDMLGGAEEMKKQFSQLKNLKKGPADKFADAIKSGDYQKAIESLKSLQQKLQDGEMNPQDQKRLAEQLNQMADKLQQMVATNEQAKKQLQQQVDEAKKRGDQDQARKLQQKLDQMNQQNGQMDQMQQMAQKLSQCSQCMGQGQQKPGQGQGQSDLQAAMSELNELAQDLQQLQLANSELAMLDEALDQIAMAKEAMNCQQCNGMGCGACNGGMGMDGPAGIGMGKGRGKGDRPEDETDTGFYDSKAKADPARGQAVVVGEVRGPNTAGDARVEIQQQIEAFTRSGGDPLTGKRLPKAQLDHVQEYFKALKPEE